MVKYADLLICDSKNIEKIYSKKNIKNINLILYLLHMEQKQEKSLLEDNNEKIIKVV